MALALSLVVNLVVWSLAAASDAIEQRTSREFSDDLFWVSFGLIVIVLAVIWCALLHTDERHRRRGRALALTALVTMAPVTLIFLIVIQYGRPR